MKTKLYSLSTIFTLGLLAIPAMAQVPSPSPMSGTLDYEMPAEETATHHTLAFLAERFNKVSLNALITGMQGQQHERKMLAAFSAEGAVLYNEEMRKDQFDDQGNFIEHDAQFDRTQGIQLMPYTVSILSNGRAFVSAGLMGFRNQDPRAPMITSPGGRGATRTFKKIPALLSAADVLVFEWDNRFSYDNLMTRKLKLGDAKFALPLARNHSRTKVLALTAGGDVAFTHAQLETDDGRKISIGAHGGEGYALNPGASVGLQFDRYNRIRGGTHFQAKAEVKGNWLNGSFKDDRNPVYLTELKDYEIDMAQYNLNEAAWLIEHKVAPHAGCEGHSGEKPVAPEVPIEKIKGTTVIFSPSVSYERPMNSHVSKSRMDTGSTTPTRMIGVTAGANIPLRADFKGGTVMQDQMNHLNNVVNAGVFLKF
ncbi:MAG: hypothetical protein H7333_03595 [Bdellovibrionales bacterium]|nr:hypothetical protein [Oligoflexia bacterium]